MALTIERRALALVDLIGERTGVLHGPGERGGQSGRDIDCLVEGLDPLWPMRLPAEWRLCQWTQYDFRAWYWVLERAGEFVAFDTTDDPEGFGRDALRTRSLLAQTAGGRPALRAAYLTVKRMRKHVTDPASWAAIREVAGEDPEGFMVALASAAGPRLAELLGPAALHGMAPSRSELLRANGLRWWRRFGSPARVVRALTLAARRYVERVARPSGFLVVVAGPDGAGKSALADVLPSSCAPMFRRHARSHWRPGVLPRPGSLLLRGPADPTEPHARRPYGPLPSALLLGYYWLDFWLGAVLRDLPTKIRTGLVVRERGWWDLAVDPVRYRLQVSPRLVRALGAMLPRPDLVIVLEGNADLLVSRKPELDPAEVRRQLTAWRAATPAAVPTVRLDVSRPADEVVSRATEVVATTMESRALSRLGRGWVALPTGTTRWWLARGPRAVATASVLVYHPITFRALTGWTLARAVAAGGGFRFLPRGPAPPRAVRRMLAPQIPRGGTVSVARATHPNRFVALIIEAAGTSRAVAKLALDSAGERALQEEAESLRCFGPLLPSPLSAPRVLQAEAGLLLLEPVDWMPRRSAWRLDEDVARALGEFFRAGKDDEGIGPAHGDCAPWNLLQTARGWTLVDWESARTAPAFHDVCHHVVQTHALLGMPSASAVVAGFREGEGWVGRAVRAYADGAGLRPESASEHLVRYLRDVTRSPVARTRSERRGIARRRQLLARLEG